MLLNFRAVRTQQHLSCYLPIVLTIMPLVTPLPVYTRRSKHMQIRGLTGGATFFSVLDMDNLVISKALAAVITRRPVTVNIFAVLILTRLLLYI